MQPSGFSIHFAVFLIYTQKNECVSKFQISFNFIMRHNHVDLFDLLSFMGFCLVFLQSLHIALGKVMQNAVITVVQYIFVCTDQQLTSVSLHSISANIKTSIK